MDFRLNRRDFLKLAALLAFSKLSDFHLPIAQTDLGLSSARANIIILVFDALASQNMSLYGYPRQTTPNLERFAQKAIVYNAHYATGSFTTPGTASLLTGTYPWTHRAFHLHGTIIKELEKDNLFNLIGKQAFKLGYSHNLLATSLLKQMSSDLDQFLYAREMALLDLQYSDKLFPKDYNSSLWSESAILRTLDVRPSSLFLSHIYRVWQVLRERQLENEFKNEYPQGITENNGVYYILEQGIDWCIEHIKNLPQPFIVYLHFLPPHHPYLPRKEFINRFQDGYVPVPKPRHRLSRKINTQEYLNKQRQAYDEYLAYADSEFGRLLDDLEKGGMLDNTYLAFTSDHGEMFERGIWGHNTRTLFDPVIRVPMILSKPGQTQRQDVFEPTSNVDMVPTLLKCLGLPIPNWIEGRILPGFTDGSNFPDRSIYAMEMKRNHARGTITTGSFALIKGHHKLVHYLGDKLRIFELYDLHNDPDELDDRIRQDKPIAKSLKIELAEKIKEVNQSITTLTHR